MAERKEFSSSESPCLPKASHQVSAQSESYRFVWFAAFNNLSVISWWCLDVAGSSMLTFRVLPHWNITPQNFDIIFHQVPFYRQLADQFFMSKCLGRIPPSPILLTLSWPVLALLSTDVVSRFSRWPPWWPSWILEWNFSNSNSPSHPNATHQV